MKFVELVSLRHYEIPRILTVDVVKRDLGSVTDFLARAFDWTGLRN